MTIAGKLGSHPTQDDKQFISRKDFLLSFLPDILFTRSEKKVIFKTLSYANSK